MRRVMMGDLVAAAAVVAAAPIAARADIAASLIYQADAAHRYFKRFRRPHLTWGDGSLLSRACAAPNRAPPNLCDARFLQVLALTTGAAAAHKSFAAHAGGR